MTALLLARHGSTGWTHEGRLQGRTDIDLSEAGMEDVRRLAPIVASWHPQTVISSPLVRSLSTARLLTPIEPTIDERWTEAGLGEWEGRTASAIGSDYRLWRAGRLVPPGGEDAADVGARIEAAVLAAAAQPGPVLVVTHGGSIRAALSRFVGLATGSLIPVAAPSLTVLDVDTDAATARLKHFNLVADARSTAGPNASTPA